MPITGFIIIDALAFEILFGNKLSAKFKYFNKWKVKKSSIACNPLIHSIDKKSLFWNVIIYGNFTSF